MIVYGGLTATFDLAANMLALSLSGVTAAALVPAADDPSLSYARPNFSLIQLLFALGMAAACICVFFSVVSHSLSVENGVSHFCKKNNLTVAALTMRVELQCSLCGLVMSVSAASVYAV